MNKQPGMELRPKEREKLLLYLHFIAYKPLGSQIPKNPGFPGLKKDAEQISG
jgi:hypothetical protein